MIVWWQQCDQKYGDQRVNKESVLYSKKHKIISRPHTALLKLLKPASAKFKLTITSVDGDHCDHAPVHLIDSRHCVFSHRILYLSSQKQSHGNSQNLAAIRSFTVHEEDWATTN